MGQVFGLNLHRQEFVTGKFRTKGRPGSVDFGLVAAEEISNHRGDERISNCSMMAGISADLSAHGVPTVIAIEACARPITGPRLLQSFDHESN